jgi:Uncharacterized protein conserved in bacteria (DUF2171)
MTTDKIAQNMGVIGANGVRVGTVESVANGRIRLVKRDSGEGQHKGHGYFHRPRTGRRRRGFAFLRTRRRGDVRGGAVGKACLTKESPMTLTTRKA